MCGVFAYLGESCDVGETIGGALKRLEYRGYDSWGIAWEADEQFHCKKQIGRVNGSLPVGTLSGLAFGHTRWATHGDVTEANAHPHFDCTGHLAIVHNGVVENAETLRASLADRHQLCSATDSEVIAHLLEEHIADTRDTLREAMRSVFPLLEGFNAVVAVDVRTRELVATKYVSPLVLGSGQAGHFIASDVLALAGHTERFTPIEDHWLVSIKAESLDIEDIRSRRELFVEQGSLPPLCVSADSELAESPGQHMLREMREQPHLVTRLLDDVEEVRRLGAMIEKADQVIMTGCGSAYYAAEAGKYLLASIGGRSVSVVQASEFRHFSSTFDDRTLLIALTQSGETADLIDALMAAEEIGVHTAALVNVEHSTVARRVEHVVPLLAGTERCVLATKSFVAKLTRLIQLAHVLGLGQPDARQSLARAATAMSSLEACDTMRASVAHAADVIAAHDHAFVIGRGISYAAALEAALKIKEGSYVHAEAFAGGELKHGVISLVTNGTPCIVFAPGDVTHPDAITGAQELRSRGGVIIGIGAENSSAFDIHLAVPETGPSTLLSQIYLAQWLAREIALRRGTDPDYPRNLAKSVTVK